jgi:hypothetical protein
MSRSARILIGLLATGLLVACTTLPASGPSARGVRAGGPPAIRVVDVDDAVTQRLLARRARRSFS